MAEPEIRPGAKRHLLVAAVVLLLCAAAYANTLQNGFVYDDNAIVAGNPLIRSLENLPRIFRTGYWGAENTDAGLYRPVVIATYAFDHALWGYRPSCFHAVNIALHGLVSVLGYLLLLVLLKRPVVAAVGAFIFAVHPVHVEAVSGIVGRAEILSAGFTLLALLFHFGYIESGGRRRVIGAAVAYLLALLTKESAIVLPLLAVAIEASARATPRPASEPPARRFGWRVYAGYGAALLAVGLLRLLVLGPQQTGGPAAVSIMDNPLYDLPAAQRIGSALYVLGRYVALLAVPLRLSADYSYSQIPPLLSLLDARVLAALAVGFVGAWLLLRSFGRHHAFLVGAVLLMGPLLPVSNLVVPIGTILAERLLYLPTLGFALILALGFQRTARRRQRAFAWGALGVMLALYGARTVDRNRDWRDDSTLFAAALDVVPRSSRMHLYSGRYLSQIGRYDEAIERLEESLEILPGNPDAIGELGYAHLGRGDFVEAERRFREAVRIDPDDVGGHYGLGRLCQQQGRYGEALDAFRRCVDIAPLHLDARVQTGIAHYAAGDVEKAAAAFESVLNLDPTALSAEYYLGLMERERGSFLEARRRYERVAASARAWDIESHVYLGLVCDELGWTDQAYVNFAAAASLNPLSAFARGALAQHLLRRGAYREASDEAGRALERNRYAVDALQARGLAELALGHVAHAESALVAARSLRATDPVTALHLARVYIAANDLAQAERELRRAWVVRPASGEVLVARAELERARGNRALARSLLSEARQSPYDSISLDLDLIRLDIDEGRTEPALRALAVISRRADLPAAHRFRVALLYESLGRIAEADRAMTATLAAQPKHAEYLYRRGRLLLEAGRLDEAETTLRDLLGLYGQHSDGMNALAWLLLQRIDGSGGSAGEALRWADAAVGVDSTRASYHDTRARALDRLGRSADAAGARETAARLDPAAAAHAARASGRDEP
jgi:tetratricopeptide (TPR) repeat protein